MNNNKERKEVEIFPKSNSPNSACCSCNCGPSDSGESPVMEEVIKELKTDYKDKFEIYLADYSTNAGKTKAIGKLDRIFKENKHLVRVDNRNLEMVLTQIAPIIAVNNEIVSIGMVPSASQLVQAVLEGKKLVPTASCC